MKPIILVITFFSFISALSQDKSKLKHEFGTKLISLTIQTNIYSSIADHRYFQFVTGIFYRMTEEKKAFRASVNYSENKTESFFVDINQMSTLPRGFSTNKDFQVALGGQISLLKKSEALYYFTDIYYRSLSSEGELYFFETRMDDRFFAKSDQFGVHLGLGSKLKLHEHIYLSPEIVCDVFHSQTSMVQYSKIDNRQLNSFNSLYDIRPIARLFLTIAF